MHRLIVALLIGLLAGACLTLPAGADRMPAKADTAPVCVVDVCTMHATCAK